MDGRFVCTYAQNGTDVNLPVLRALEQFALKHKAEVLVQPGYYTRSFLLHDRESDWWDPSVAKYLLKDDIQIGTQVKILGDLNILPSAKRPLGGIQKVSGEQCLVVFHPKREFRALPGYGKYPRTAMTTGAVTYSNALGRIGYEARETHCFGACYVEPFGDGLFHLYDLNWNGEAIVHRSVAYYPNGNVEKLPCVARLGDLHFPHHDEIYIDAVASFLKPLDVDTVLVDDVLDFDTWNHHDRHNPFRSLEWTVREQLEGVSLFYKQLREKLSYVVAMHSNHDDHVDRWLRETDWRTDMINREVYLELALQSVRDPATPAIYNYLDQDWTDEFDSWGVTNVHGHQGPNGARGSANGFAQLGKPITIQHVHTPAILDRVYAGGTGCKMLDYTQGSPSGWLQTLILTTPPGEGYDYGTRQLLTCIEGHL